MPTAPVNGIDLYYELDGDGPAVVFAHGVGGNHASWYQQVLAFRERYTVVTFDHRGFGRSHADPGADARSWFIDDLEGLLDYLGLEKTALVAQSMGGGTCVGLTARNPARISALVLADTLLGIALPPDIRVRMDEVRAATDDLGQLERVLGPKFREREPLQTQLYAGIASLNVATRRNLSGTYGTPVTMEDLASTGVPMLFLVGRDDVLMPADLIEALQRLIPGSRLVVVPNAGHSVYFEAPETFNSAVLGFLEEAGV